MILYIATCFFVFQFPLCLFAQDLDLDWEIHIGGPGFDVTRVSCTDDLGNIYFTGFFQDTVFINGNMYVAKGKADIFTIKADLHGNIMWVNTAGSNYCRENLIFEMGNGIDVDENSDVYICGTFASLSTFESESVRSNGGKDIFIAKYHGETGKLIWVKNIGGKGHDIVSDLCIDRSDNIVLTGNISPGAKFGESICNNNSTVSFVSKLDEKGNFLWLKYIEGTGYLEGVSAITDKLNNIYWGINFRDGIKSKKEIILSKGDGDIYIEKLSAEGELLWQNHLFGEQTVRMSFLDLSLGNEIIITGSFMGKMKFGSKSIEAVGQKDIFLCKCNEKGELIWLKSAGGYMNDIAKAEFCNSRGEVYLAGEFQGRAFFDQDTLHANENTDLFIAKYSIDGNLIYVQKLDHGLHKHISSIVGDPLSNIYLSGGFKKQITFGDELLSSVGKSDLFITRILDHEIYKDALVNVESDISNPKIKLFKINPNPTSGILNIEFSSLLNSEVEIKVTNVFGRTTALNFDKSHQPFSVDLSPYPKGIYLLTITTNSKVYTEKIILQ